MSWRPRQLVLLLICACEIGNLEYISLLNNSDKFKLYPFGGGKIYKAYTVPLRKSNKNNKFYSTVVNS